MTTHISYHPNTGIAFGLVTLGVSPLEPDAMISQAYATPKLLPDVPAGFVACYLDPHGAPPYSYTNGDWIIQRDWRDTPLYLYDGRRYVVGDVAAGRVFCGVGDLPDWLVEIAPPDECSKWDGDKWVDDHARMAKQDELLASNIRSKRDSLLFEIYDKGTQIIYRALRKASSQQEKDALNAKLAELDDYADALTAIPEQGGFPRSVVWPDIPSREIA